MHEVVGMVGTRSLSSGAHSRDPVALPTLRHLPPTYVAAGFFFALAGFGCDTGSGPRSIDDKRPAVKV